MILTSFLASVWFALTPLCGLELCRCLPSPPPLEARAQSVAVFVGEVTSITHSEQTLPAVTGNDTFSRLLVPPSRLARLRVLRSFKGVSDSVVEVRAGLGMCSFPFEVGRQYLVYARGADGNLGTSTCTRTRSVELAGEDLVALAGSQP